jgi:prophage antirepressor-like protein
MLRELTPFKSDSNQLRVAVFGGEPRFLMADICAILERTNPFPAISGLDLEDVQADDFSTLSFNEGVTVQTLSPDQKISVTHEAGLYTLILRNNKDKAKPAEAEQKQLAAEAEQKQLAAEDPKA